jgi:hypothetical protein
MCPLREKETVLGPASLEKRGDRRKPRCGPSLAYCIPDCKSRATELSLLSVMMAIRLWMHEHEHVHEALSHSHPHVHDDHHRHSHKPEDLLGEPHTHALASPLPSARA